MDDEPIPGSENLVKSGGVYNSFKDVSKGLSLTAYYSGTLVGGYSWGNPSDVNIPIGVLVKNIGSVTVNLYEEKDFSGQNKQKLLAGESFITTFPIVAVRDYGVAGTYKLAIYVDTEMQKVSSITGMQQDIEGKVDYTKTQSLTDQQKTKALENLGIDWVNQKDKLPLPNSTSIVESGGVSAALNGLTPICGGGTRSYDKVRVRPESSMVFVEEPSTLYSYYWAVSKGQLIHFNASNSTSAGIRLCFSENVPALNGSLSNYIPYTNIESLNVMLVAPFNGYFVVYRQSNKFEDANISVINDVASMPAYRYRGTAFGEYSVIGSVDIPNGAIVRNVGAAKVQLWDSYPNGSSNVIAYTGSTIVIDFNAKVLRSYEQNAKSYDLFVYTDADAVILDNGKTIKSALETVYQRTALGVTLYAYPARNPYADTVSGYFKGYKADLTGLYENGIRGVVFRGTQYIVDSSIIAGEIFDENNNILSYIQNTSEHVNKSVWHILPLTAASKTLQATYSIQDGFEPFTPVVVYAIDIKTYEAIVNGNSQIQEEIEELQADVNKIKSDKYPKTFLPSKIYGVVGDTQQLFVRGIVCSFSPYRYYNKFTCNVGKVYERYLEITPSEVATGLTIKHKFFDDNCESSSETTSDYIIAAKPTVSPANNINVLCVGASTTVGGQWAGELKRRLTGTLGSGTPSADGLTNITFVGRKNGTSDANVKVEATGGWTWSTFVTQRDAIRLSFSSGSGFSYANLGSIYTYKDANNNDVRVELAEVNMTGDSGNMLFTFDTSNHNAPANTSGTLTKVSGSGSSPISFSSYETESYAPFYYNGAADFAHYAQEYCDGQIDVAIFDLGSINAGILGALPWMNNSLSAAIANMKIVLDALHADFPNCKVIISTGSVSDTHHGMEDDYGAASNLTTIQALVGKFAYDEAVQEFISDDNYNEWCFLSNVQAEVDAEYVYPTTTKAVNTRVTDKTEVVGTNGQHPNNSGYYMKADSIYRCFVNVVL